MKQSVKWDQELKCFRWSSEKEQTDKQNDTSPEICTMTEFTRMASGIFQCLEFTFDSPASNPNGQMPVLDMTMWIQTQSRQVGIPEEIRPPDTEIPDRVGQLVKVIMYKFYRKDIANKVPFNARSAGPIKDKIQQVSQDFLRRFRNTSRMLPTSHINQVMEEFCVDLKRGGFHAPLIQTSLRSAIVGWSKM